MLKTLAVKISPHSSRMILSLPKKILKQQEFNHTGDQANGPKFQEIYS
jgi:hypothetical protein